MLSKNIKYTDFNGIEREEKFFFNLSEAELTEMQLSTKGGLAGLIQQVVEAQDTPSLIKIFKEIILKAYGEKSTDGRRFMKKDKDGTPLSQAFSETEAYSKLFMELATDDNAAASFIEGIIPASIDKTELENQMKLLQSNQSNTETQE